MDALEVLDFKKSIILPSWPFSGSHVAALDALSIGHPVWSDRAFSRFVIISACAKICDMLHFSMFNYLSFL